MKILVIDDEPIVRRSLRRACERRGHSVLEAENGISGLHIWRAESPDLVFLDVLMPGMSGPAVLQEIKSENRAKVLLMSAYSGDYDLEKAKELGADDFAAKPFNDIFKIVEFAEKLIDGNTGQRR